MYHLQTGLAEYPLQHPRILLYTSGNWIKQLINSMTQFDIHIQRTSKFQLSPQRDNDQCIMQCLQSNIKNAQTLRKLNLCRMYLQVTYISEISNEKGDCIDPRYFYAHQHTSRIIWPNIPPPPQTIWKTWKNAIRLTLCLNSITYKLKPQ